MQKQYPQPVAGLFILNKKNQLLLIKSHKWQNGKIWSVPGGRVEIGETIEHAAKRESIEEIGLKVKFIKVFTVFDAINPRNFYKKAHFIFLECLLFTENDNFQIDENEIQHAQWFDFDKIDFSKTEYFTIQTIKELKKIL
jgi:ADP-ribose pyrophosphatase YjhB (NUDIX family)